MMKQAQIYAQLVGDGVNIRLFEDSYILVEEGILIINR